MTSRLHFELFLQQFRLRATEPAPRQFPLERTRADVNEDVGTVRLSQIEAAMKEARVDRTDE
jgi:hypothetical protein